MMAVCPSISSCFIGAPEHIDPGLALLLYQVHAGLEQLCQRYLPSILCRVCIVVAEHKFVDIHSGDAMVNTL